MSKRLEQDVKTLEKKVKVLVPVRRHKADKEAESEIQEKLRPVKQWVTPRRWYGY